MLGVRLLALYASTPSEIETAFETLVREGAGGLVVTGEAFFFFQRDQIAALAARYKVPAIGLPGEGLLMAYGANVADMYRQGGVYAGRILKGANPADLPVVQPTKLQLIINMKTAKTLGITFPTGLLVRADEVIE